MRCLVLLLLCIAAVPARAADRADYLPLVLREAARRNVPPEIADAVAMVETGYRADAIGTSGEIGIMQVMPATARQLGFNGTLEGLFAPETNIALGVEYLSRAWAMSGGDICRTLMKYRAGLGEKVMTPLSGDYCARAVAWLRGGRSLLATGLTLPEPAAPDPFVTAMAPGGARLRPVLAMAEAPLAYRRSMADRDAALQARVDSHRRRPAEAASRAAAAIAAAGAEE